MGDWARLDGMAPYEWAFCFSAYNAPTAAAAESVSIARPEAPKTGCNGYPYTRMRAVTAPRDDLRGLDEPSDARCGGLVIQIALMRPATKRSDGGTRAARVP